MVRIDFVDVGQGGDLKESGTAHAHEKHVQLVFGICSCVRLGIIAVCFVKKRAHDARLRAGTLVIPELRMREDTTFFLRRLASDFTS